MLSRLLYAFCNCIYFISCLVELQALEIRLVSYVSAYTISTIVEISIFFVIRNHVV